MKINEITEQPVSGIKTKLQGLGSRILNRIPGQKGRALNLAARADLGDTASNAYNEFSKWLGDRNKAIGQADGNDLKSFLNDAGLDSSKVSAGPLDKKTLNAAMIDAATQIKTGSSTPNVANTATKKTKTVKPTAPKQQNVKVASKDARSIDYYEKYKSQIRKLQSPSGQPLPDKFLQSVSQDIRKLAKGDKESGAVAAEKILKFARAGRDVSGLQQQWLKSAKVGERFLTQSVYRFVSNLLAECKLSWKDLGLTVRLTESQNNKQFILISKI